MTVDIRNNAVVLDFCPLSWFLVVGVRPGEYELVLATVEVGMSVVIKIEMMVSTFRGVERQ